MFPISLSREEGHQCDTRGRERNRSAAPFKNSGEVESQSSGEVERSHQGECGIRGRSHKAHEIARQGSQGDEEYGKPKDCGITAVDKRVSALDLQQGHRQTHKRFVKSSCLGAPIPPAFRPLMWSALRGGQHRRSYSPGCKYSFSNCSGVNWIENCLPSAPPPVNSGP